jgi:hypothetical protein
MPAHSPGRSISLKLRSYPALMIGTLHAFQNISSGGLNNMKAQLSEIRNGHDPAI